MRVTSQKNTPKPTIAYTASEPLWKRAPTRDETGQRLSDFMMFIPGLNKQTELQVRQVAEKIAAILQQFDDVVVFADLNLKLNVLWVSIKPRPGMCIEIPAHIHHHIPQAKLVAQKA